MRVFIFLLSLISSFKERRGKLKTKPNPSLLSIPTTKQRLETLRKQLLLTENKMSQTPNTQIQYKRLKEESERLKIQIHTMQRELGINSIGDIGIIRYGDTSLRQ